MLELRPDQKKVKHELYAAIRDGHDKIIVQAMTSFGKTALAVDITKDALAKGVKVIFTAPMITLVEQAYEEFKKFGIDDIGIIQADNPLTDRSQPVQVCSIQSIKAMMKRDIAGWRRFQKGRLILHDEVHLEHETHRKMNEYADKPVIGLSATPWRKGLADEYTKLILAPDTSWLIDNGMLCKFRAYSHHVPDMKGVKTNAGDYSLKESGEKYEPKVIADIVSTWQKYGEGRKTILFAPRVVDAERFAEEFKMAGVTAVAVSGYMDQDDCSDEIDKFRSGETTIICSVSKLATGFSVKDVGCIIDAQPTKSVMRHLQKLGRGLRTHPDKDDVIFLDNAGNLLRNGLPDGEFPTALLEGTSKETDRKKPEDPLPTVCSACNAMKPPKVHVCPSCGFAPEKKSELEVEAGELVMLSGKKRKPTKADKQKWYSMLMCYADGKEYKNASGWAANTYRDKFGVWPKGLSRSLITPDLEVRKFIMYKNIKWANRKK